VWFPMSIVPALPKHLKCDSLPGMRAHSPTHLVDSAPGQILVRKNVSPRNALVNPEKTKTKRKE
jgi:hypothetical protein